MLDLEKALAELKSTNYQQIQEQTAWTWASRACVCYNSCADQQDNRVRLACWAVGEEYYHEAVEHAALYDGEIDLVKAIRQAVAPHQEQASRVMFSNLGGPTNV